MPISTNAAIDVFGTADTVTASGGTAAVVNGAFSAAADVVSGGWTNDDDAPIASVILTCAFSVAPTANTAVNLFARPLNIDGTKDSLTPEANYRHVFLGSFPVLNTTSEQVIPVVVSLPNVYTSQLYEFYIENSSGQTMTAGWKLTVTPRTIAPHA